MQASLFLRRSCVVAPAVATAAAGRLRMPRRWFADDATGKPVAADAEATKEEESPFMTREQEARGWRDLLSDENLAKVDELTQGDDAVGTGARSGVRGSDDPLEDLHPVMNALDEYAKKHPSSIDRDVIRRAIRPDIDQYYKTKWYDTARARWEQNKEFWPVANKAITGYSDPELEDYGAPPGPPLHVPDIVKKALRLDLLHTTRKAVNEAVADMRDHAARVSRPLPPVDVPAVVAQEEPYINHVRHMLEREANDLPHWTRAQKEELIAEMSNIMNGYADFLSARREGETEGKFVLRHSKKTDKARYRRARKKAKAKKKTAAAAE